MEPVLYHGYEQIGTTVGGREAIIVKPNVTPNGKWALKTEYFDAFPSVQLSLLAKGYHLAYVKNVTRWYYPADTDAHLALANHMRDEWGLSEKCVIIGMSCGGMIGVKLAARHPECVSALYLDAPVMNLLSCPAGVGKGRSTVMQEFTNHTGMTLVDLMSYREHPIDKMHLLLENKIPVFIVYGTADPIVPYDENGEILEKYYRAGGGVIETVGKPGCAHHPHGLEDNTPIIEFAEKHRL